LPRSLAHRFRQWLVFGAVRFDARLQGLDPSQILFVAQPHENAAQTCLPLCIRPPQQGGGGAPCRFARSVGIRRN
jgi:hypothetical protein